MEESKSRYIAENMASIATIMSYSEWSRARNAIEKAFDAQKAKARLADKDELAGAIESELVW